jgi:hypothetical protein
VIAVASKKQQWLPWQRSEDSAGDGDDRRGSNVEKSLFFMAANILNLVLALSVTFHRYDLLIYFINLSLVNRYEGQLCLIIKI